MKRLLLSPLQYETQSSVHMEVLFGSYTRVGLLEIAQSELTRESISVHFLNFFLQFCFSAMQEVGIVSPILLIGILLIYREYLHQILK